MRDSLLWLSHFRHFINELQQCWDGDSSGTATGAIEREEPQVTQFVYGYPTFSGKRNGDRVSATIDYFHHAVTTKMSRSDHVEMLCLSLKKPQQGFISLRDLEWFDNTLELMSTRWQTLTGDPVIDKLYFIEASTPANQAILALPEFHSLIKGLLPFSSIAFRVNGIHWSRPIETGAQLAVSLVESVWDGLASLARLIEQSSPTADSTSS